MKDCAVLVSGGVDSSVALRLVKEQGYRPTAFYLKIWLEDELAYLGDCPWQEDLAYVQEVCKQAGVPLEVISLQRAYWDRVVSHTVAEIQAGRTPNPDILCNQRVKFGAFYEQLAPSFATVASGHYARLSAADGGVELHRAPDPVKDQTYFLSHVSQEQLQRVTFPLGRYTKEEVRAKAHAYALPNRNRKDSQGICFLGKLKFAEFVKHHVGEQPGELIEFESGKVVGEHKGFWFYTIGQRHGIGLSGGPWYVVAKDPAKNQVLISRSYYTNEKMRDSFTISDCNWINRAPSEQTLSVKVRHGAQLYTAAVEPQSDESYRIRLHERDQGLAEGQYAVLYDGTRCLGGGVIAHDHT